MRIEKKVFLDGKKELKRTFDENYERNKEQKVYFVKRYNKKQFVEICEKIDIINDICISEKVSFKVIILENGNVRFETIGSYSEVMKILIEEGW